MTCPVAGIPDGVPYAVHLADEAGRFWLLAFDFDAHGPGSRAQEDAADFSAQLAGAGVEHLVCQSGPSGGIHVWVRLSSPTAAKQVARFANVARSAYPSLDITPLANPVTGCVRPPGAPHRLGGRSIPVGETRIGLVDFSALAAVVPHLRQRAAATGGCSTPKLASLIPILTDPDGSTYLDGPRRPLSPKMRVLADRQPGEGEDLSAAAYAVLLGMVHARMHLDDAVRAAFVEGWPALEHLRTSADGTGRVPRSNRERHLQHVWSRAVAAAALVPATEYVDQGSPGRRRAEATVASLMAAVDSQPDRWTGKTGSQDQLILMALAHRVLTAATDVVHLSERAWALHAGLTRDVISDRLPVLVGQGWVRRVRGAAGPWAARWALAKGGAETGSGAVFTPSIEKRLSAMLRSARADVWHAGELGVLGWRVWAELRKGWVPVRVLTRRIGVCAVTVRRKLAALQRLRLVAGDGRAYAHASRMRRAAEAAGVEGAHADRVRLYKLQSAVFVWWFTARYQPVRDDGSPSDALAEWGEFPSQADAAEVHPDDIALAYGAVSHGPPPEPTTWAAAMVAQEAHRHADPDYWWRLVAEARAALPPADVLTSPSQWVPAAARRATAFAR